jgi:DNA processing protein
MLLTVSFLGTRGDTRVERAFKDLIAEPLSPSLLEALAARLGFPVHEGRLEVAAARESARRALEAGSRLGLTLVDGAHPAYPDRLRHIADPPIVLWVKGDVEALSAPQVAVVGARAATPAGVWTARQLGRDLASAGLVVVSGMARGVDGAAHAGALEAGGRTIAVLGCGIDVVYPPEHTDLSERIAGAGAIVSELAPGAPPRREHFPMRNRIISGLSHAVVVIEASDRSGSLITAKAALDQGRDVLAVPGGVLSGRSRGCHRLIRDGARLVDTVADVLDEIGWVRAPAPRAEGTKSLQTSQLEETMAAGESYTVDDLASRTGRAVPDLLADLGELELAGRIARVPGGGFTRT